MCQCEGCMCSRIFPLAFLLSLSVASAAQQSGGAKPVDVSTTCPVTKPEQTSLFVPPSPYSAKAPAGTFWFGSDRLWTAVPANGSWKGLPHYTPNDPSFRQKLFFGREGYDWHTEPQPRLKVTGETARLFGSACSVGSSEQRVDSARSAVYADCYKFSNTGM